MQSIEFLDSHTGGEPTRLVLRGGPDLGAGPLSDRLERFRQKFDAYRSAIVNEPRGSDVLVGALLVSPHRQDCKQGVIFFNNVGYLGMCGHGMIGVIASLAHLGLLEPGEQRVDTPVGAVTTKLHPDGGVSVRNVPAYRYRAGVAVELPGQGRVHGDIAWGGNWFFLCEDHGQDLSLDNVDCLTQLTWNLRQALKDQGLTGAGGQEIDHIELFGPPHTPETHSRNFVLCPGKAYDRSPCGTGTSAKVACLHADGKLDPGEVWCQESITGSRFEAVYEVEGDKIVPTVKGWAYVNGRGKLLLDDKDPLCWGIRRW